MKARIRNLVYVTRATLFTIILHGVLIAVLLGSLWWPFSKVQMRQGTIQAIKAKAVSVEEIKEWEQTKRERAEQENEEEAELKRKEEEQQLKREREQQVKKAEEARKRKIEEGRRRRVLEEERKVEEERKRKEDEVIKRQEEERRKAELEKMRKAEEEKKRKAEAVRKQKEGEERLRQEEALRLQLEAEQRESLQREATNALTDLHHKIASIVEHNWRRPKNSQTGLEATITVKVARNGEVLSVNVVQSSGNSFFDKSAKVAIEKASPLPFPPNPNYYEFINEFNLLFNPDDL